ncbi:MAG: metal ABC transporter ATP-binding protein [Nocardioides sp.]
MTTVLELRGVRVNLAGRPVLRDLDLTVVRGEFVALMGANGSGKSTLVRAATGLRPLAGGSVELFGIPLADFREWPRLGFVPQRATAASGVPASVREVVASGRLGRRRLFAPMSRADRRAVDDALEVVRLTDRATDNVAALSGGQQQRVLIARALAGEPDLFFLDEPTAGVDVPNQQALAASLGVLADRGATVVLVAHELGPMAPLVKRSVVLAHGQVTYDGVPLDDHGAHGHHHPRQHRHDHTPHVGSPLDARQEEAT